MKKPLLMNLWYFIVLNMFNERVKNSKHQTKTYQIRLYCHFNKNVKGLFSREYYGTFKNNSFYRRHLLAASKLVQSARPDIVTSRDKKAKS